MQSRRKLLLMSHRLLSSRCVSSLRRCSPTNCSAFSRKVDVDGKKITVVEKDTDKEIEIKITDETEQVSKKGNGKVDLEKLETQVQESHRMPGRKSTSR